MPIVLKLIPRRRETWVEIIPDDGLPLRLPRERLPAGIAPGSAVSEADWATLTREAAYYGLLDSALRILAHREHFEAELRRKLSARERDSRLVEQVMAHCRASAYLDDARAAELIAGQLVSRGGIGRPRLKAELYRRGCPPELIGPALEHHAGGIDEREEAAQLLAARRRQFASRLAQYERRLRLKQPDARRRAFELKRLLSAAVWSYLAAQGLMSEEAREEAGAFVAGLLEEQRGAGREEG